MGCAVLSVNLSQMALGDRQQIAGTLCPRRRALGCFLTTSVPSNREERIDLSAGIFITLLM